MTLQLYKVSGISEPASSEAFPWNVIRMIKAIITVLKNDSLCLFSESMQNYGSDFIIL